MHLKLDCNDVDIIEPSGSLTFDIDVPSTAPSMFNPGGVHQSDALFYWMMTSKSYTMHG